MPAAICSRTSCSSSNAAAGRRAVSTIGMMALSAVGTFADAKDAEMQRYQSKEVTSVPGHVEHISMNMRLRIHRLG